MSRVVVTGASGFVGANLARRLVRDGHDVHLLLRPAHRSWRIAGIRHDVTVHELQLDDAEAAERILGSLKPRWVFHLAVYGAYSWQTEWRRMVQTNVVGTITLAEASLAAGAEVFVNTGSSSEYGFKMYPSAESDALEPNSYYAVTKASGTLFCQHLARTHGARVPTLRLYSVFGPYEDPRRLVPALVMRGLKAELPPLADPGIARDFVYVDDAVDAYIKAATILGKEPGAVYNVGTGIQISLREAVDTARRVFAISASATWDSMPRRQWDTSVWVADTRKIRAELGWQPLHTFEEGLRATATWLRSDPDLLAMYAEAQSRNSERSSGAHDEASACLPAVNGETGKR